MNQDAPVFDLVQVGYRINTAALYPERIKLDLYPIRVCIGKENIKDMFAVKLLETPGNDCDR